MPILESDIEVPAIKFARRLGYIVLKLTPQGQRGWPDRLFITPSGRHIYIEFKRPGEKLRKLQEYRCSQLAQRGIAVYRGIDKLEEVKEILYEYL